MDKTKGTYKAYLRSPEWQAKREERLQLDGYRCTRCFCKSSLEVHHLTYERLGWELLEDLLTLCGNCHHREHRLPVITKEGSLAEYLDTQDGYRSIFIEQNGATWLCYFCSELITEWGGVGGRNLIIHHIDSTGRTTHPNNAKDNLAGAHWDCHSSWHATAQWADPTTRAKMVTALEVASRRLWDDPEYRAKMAVVFGASDYRAKVSARVTEEWTDPDIRAKREAVLVKARKNIDPANVSSGQKKSWENPAKREAKRAYMLGEERWGDPAYRTRMSKAHEGQVPWNKGMKTSLEGRIKLKAAHAARSAEEKRMAALKAWETRRRNAAKRESYDYETRP